MENQTTLTISISVGVGIDAQHDVTTGGDVIGRDKITQNTWSYIRQLCCNRGR